MTLGIGGFIYLRRRRREKEELFIATIPHQFIPVEPRIPSVPASQQAPTSMSGRIPFDKASSSRGVTIPSEIYRNPPSPEDNTTIPSSGGISYYPSIITSSNVTNGPTPTDNPPRYLVSPARKLPGGFTNFPSTSIRRSAKSLEASTHSAVSPDSEYVLESAISDSSNVLGRQLSAVSSARTANTARGFRPEGRVEEEAETIYQHRDGGVVRELPPPYMDRGDSEERSNQ
ncbi:hypothetical protein BDN70DRAFT_183576 [Pholiota conissans]|uniref:Uncharacterized protein n=1 Tax=Pholiota conissans TaxID=109636 RepID=A0A9P5YX38_9AGAR|nr:hypothetical protein BDN70DRAFT_183576 [Pholiota conissans]